ncbi:MAG: 4-(cytidine 5'-diphospho)-2-C-methyl-D-erythritol kinase [Treponema sp.]|nr:4-(cytidine 5'-diphospho)-2-C-methyl-D-erythritol kinase [Candidatus Treponema merdequi]
MLNEIHVTAPAKINFGLKVLPKREDGFHDIESIFSTVSLGDEIIVRQTACKNECSVKCDLFELPQQNTITKTYEAFRSLVKQDLPGVEVIIKKTIPAGGGLGGGSSDAAAFLNALSSLYGTCLTASQKDEIAAQVGSDVFFFLHCDKDGRGAAVVTGRGEKVLPITRREDLHILLVFPGVSSSTKEAYALIDEFYESGNNLDYPALNDLQGIYNGSVDKWNFVNTFTRVISSRYPQIEQAVFDLKKNGALYTDMSGSGSTVFGVFASEQELQKARNTLSLSWNVRSCS